MNLSARQDKYAVSAEFYDRVAPSRERQDVAFYVEMAGAASGPVLEIGCGTGRILIPMARAGARVTGLDASSAMLAVCREALAGQPEDVQERATLVKADMRAFDLHRQFELAVLPFRSFQHLLSVEDQLACLAAAHRHLVPAGRLVLDLFNPSIPHLAPNESTQPLLPEEPEFVLPDGRRVRRRISVVARDLFRQTQVVEFSYRVAHPDGREENLAERMEIRYLFRFEAEHLLARSGFDVEEVFADYDKSPYGSTYPGELVFVARRTGRAPAPRP